MKCCFFFNYNPLYRFPIYKKIEESFDCDFYFGNDGSPSIKQFIPELLEHYKGLLICVRFFQTPFTYYKDIKPLFCNQYEQYIITGAPFCITTWLLLAYCKIRRKKIYVWCHGLYDYVKKPFLRGFLKIYYTNMNGIFVYNHYSCPFMLDLGCKKERLHIVHNSLDTDLQSAIYDKCHASDIYRKHFTNDLPVVIYIGRVQIRKKVDQLIYACKELISNNNPVNLVIVGPNDDDESIGELVKSLNLESNVWFFGPSYDETVNAELLYNASVCVCPNGVGLSAIHSLSYGTPVVSNDDFAHQMPEFESIINEQTGSFFMSNSILDLSEHINKWVIKTDEERYKIRKMARKTILEEWSVQYQLSILKKVLG